MENDKSTSQDPEGAKQAEIQSEKAAENQTPTTTETDADKTEAVTQNGEIEGTQVTEVNSVEEVNKQVESVEVDKPAKSVEVDKPAKSVGVDKPAESIEAASEEGKKPESRPMRATRAAKRKANDADENENTSNATSNENTEQKENVNEKRQDGEQKENETDDKVDESALKSLSSADGMGKGKRARIPNKRYSDIILSPNRKAGGHKSFGDILEPDLTLSIKDEVLDPALPVEAAVSSPSLPKRGRSSLPREDLQDAKYLKPFKYGWKRELVWRSTATPGKRLGDIYYYNAEGKKLRSFREVSDNLHNKQLTLDNFTFAKEPLGLNDPEKEIVRDAKLPKSLSDNVSDSSTGSGKKKPKKAQSPKSGDSAPVTETPKVEPPKTETATPGRGRKRGAPAPVEAPSVEKKKKETVKEATTKPTPSKKIVKMPPAQKKSKETPAKRPKLSSKADESSAETTPSQPSRSSPRKTRTTEASAHQPAASSPPSKPVKRGLKLKNITNSASSGSNSAADNNKPDLSANFLGDCASIFNSLLHVFQYLKVQDLLRAGCVSRMWRAMADNPLLWRTVRMKNSQVHSFEGLANALKKHGTVHLDLRKMLLPSSGDDIWPDFSKAIARVDSLRKIEFCRCPAAVVEQLATSNPDLDVINAVTIKCDSLNLDPFKSLTAIRELRLKSTSGLNINSIDSLKQLKTLKMLSLTSVIDLHKLNLEVIGELTNLESLDLGECLDFPETFGKDILLKLDKLEKLRLEKGQGNCHTFQILESIKDMKSLEQLELVNFDVKPGFDKALGACKNIRKLMIIPTYISQSATTNNMVLAGVLRLQGTLAHFVWGVTLELLRVTELFIDQCEDSNKREKKLGNNGDCIPVLKPVPDLSNGNAIQSASNPPQVEILPLPNLQKLLLNSLPTTRVKILKIPFHATWRQTLIDSM